MWNNGMMFTQTSSAWSRKVARIHNAPQVKFPWLKGTIFGFFVVPEVCSTKAQSPRPALNGETPEARRKTSTPSPSTTVNKPHAPPAGVSLRVKTGMCRASASSTAAAAPAPAALLDAASPAAFSRTMTAAAGRSSSSNANSARASASLSGARVQCIASVKNATAAEGPFGMTKATRSVGLKDRKPPTAAAKAQSSRYRSGLRPASSSSAAP
mmetsp:Transcript_29872/g.100625  ORF Transcript_29872/g.100625 Transcript_29872/m.100625 type:complete len:212 (-) Transcript_29872:264-899(-)